MSAQEVAADVARTRQDAALFVLEGDAFARGLIAVTGGDAERWLDGMLTNDITHLDAASGAGCYALVLTPKGRIIADLHVLAREDGYWLETAASAVSRVLEALNRYIVADDVQLADRTGDFVRFGVEGPGAKRLGASKLADVAGDCWTSLNLSEKERGEEVVAVRFGWSGEDAWQLFVPSGADDEVRDALERLELATASMDALDVLRIEAGIPLLGPELDEEVFPDEARLDTAISRTKGCYTGQEIVARLYSRGAVNHLLVGLEFEGDVVPAQSSELFAGDKRSGEVTSACVSPSRGVIGLGYVRREHAEPGTLLRCEDERGAISGAVCSPLLEPRTA